MMSPFKHCRADPESVELFGPGLPKVGGFEGDLDYSVAHHYRRCQP